eukprot:Sspe_Gene.34458::Locus_16749_Transcript_1_1_Confidence_1.000_Length_1879::g.34458::m.34458
MRRGTLTKYTTPMASLRTAERLWTASLLQHDYREPPEVNVREEDGYLVAEGVLSAAEVDGILLGVEGEWCDCPYPERDGERTVVLDEDMKAVLDTRLASVFAKVSGAVPIGYHGCAEWEVEGLNECFRLTRYPKGSNGFAPHIDTPYVASPSQRSTHTALFCLGSVGSTVLHLKGHRVEVPHRTGDCIVFPHTVEHEGVSSPDKEKYVMRTDIVSVAHNDVSRGTAKQLSERLFLLAQQLELQGDFATASDLYQRSVRCRALGLAGLCHDTMAMVLPFLEIEDMEALARTSRAMRCVVQAEVRYFQALRLLRPGITPLEAWNRFPYLPKSWRVVVPAEKTEVTFDWEGSRDNVEGLLREATMVHIVYADHSADSEMYVAKYDPRTREVMGTSVQHLLWCAYNGSPCRGGYYQVNKTKQYRDDLKLAVPILRRGTDMVREIEGSDDDGAEFMTESYASTRPPWAAALTHKTEVEKWYGVDATATGCGCPPDSHQFRQEVCVSVVRNNHLFNFSSGKMEVQEKANGKGYTVRLVHTPGRLNHAACDIFWNALNVSRVQMLGELEVNCVGKSSYSLSTHWDDSRLIVTVTGNVYRPVH